MDQNPHESPQTENLPFTTIGSSNADLERRVAELERQVAQSWFLRPSFFMRVVAVWAYLMIGYLLLLSVIAPFFWLTTGRF